MLLPLHRTASRKDASPFPAMRQYIEECLGLPLAWPTIFAFHCTIPASLQWCYGWLRQRGALSVIRPVPHGEGEVYFPQYTGRVYIPGLPNALSANGAGMTWGAALTATIGEAAERFALGTIPADRLISGSSGSPEHAIDLSTLSGPSDAERSQRGWEQWCFTADSRFCWTPGIAVPSGNPVWIPAQLVYIRRPHQYAPQEPIIRLPSTNGAAAGSSPASAMKHAIAEIVEREAFMVTYLHRLAPPRIDLRDGTPLLKELSERFAASNLELHVYLLPTDAPLSVALAVILSPEHRIPAVTVGAKACWSPEQAVAGAILEANHTRIALQNEIDPRALDRSMTADTIQYPKDHARYWARPSMRSGLDFLENGPLINFGDLPQRHNNDETWLREFFAFAATEHLDVFWADLTPEPFKNRHLYVGKAIIPQMHPLHIDERFPYLGGKRLFALPGKLGYRTNPMQQEDLNVIPHPFP